MTDVKITLTAGRKHTSHCNNHTHARSLCFILLLAGYFVSWLAGWLFSYCMHVYLVGCVFILASFNKYCLFYFYMYFLLFSLLHILFCIYLVGYFLYFVIYYNYLHFLFFVYYLHHYYLLCIYLILQQKWNAVLQYREVMNNI